MSHKRITLLLLLLVVIPHTTTEAREVSYIEPPMVAIPAGEFLMGSPEAEQERHADEGPQHRVELKGFWLGKYEVSFDEWDACVADHGCDHSPDDHGWGRGRQPVINVNWDDVQQYIAWLSHNSGKPYQLPSEAQWEYAARATTTTPFSSGACITTDQGNFNGNHPYRDCPIGENRARPVAVGTLTANTWGLHDMYGNVWEWTGDCWLDNYNVKAAEGADCNQRVVRGGSWPYPAAQLRSAFRDKYARGNRNNSLGFRLALPR